MELADFWPTAQSLKEVLVSQAEGRRDTFLAIHQPMQFTVREVGSEEDQRRTTGEEHLLKALLRDEPDGCVVMPVLGRSGVGKSHAIRWLHEQISARQDSERFVLIWVPRNLSAKGVLRDLLSRAEFSGDEWDDLRTEVQKATDELSLAHAARTLRLRMVLELQEGVKGQGGSTQSDTVDRVLEDLGGMLADFIEDNNVWTIPNDRVIEEKAGDAGSLSPWIRLSQHLVKGDLDPGDEGVRKFLDADLAFPAGVGDELGAQARQFWEYLQTNPEVEQGVSFEQVTLDVLNRLLDRAKASVLGIGQTPIAELFIRVRRRLAEADRELVLLIEDLTVMSGLQRSLLDVMVQPASGPTGKAICTIRTAFALTPGYMQGGTLPDNVRTRAKREWWVEEEVDEQEILRRYEGLAGGYLDAARRMDLDLSLDAGDVLDVDGETDAELVDQIDAFGRDAYGGRPLFPLSRSAIEVLARVRVQSNNRLIYNPRLFINSVLDPVLHMRESFLCGEFPDSESGLPVPRSGEVANRTREYAPADERLRALYVVATWGGQPTTWDEVRRIPAALFHAFGLTAPPDASPGPAPPGPGPDRPKPPPGPPPVRPERDPVAGWVEELDTWRSEKEYTMSQVLANEIRHGLASMLSDLLPAGWPGLTHYPETELRKHIFIHRAGGNNQLTADTGMVSIPRRAPSASDDDWLTYRNELEALLRWHQADQAQLDYHRASETLDHLAALAHRVVDEASSFVRNHPYKLGKGVDTEALKAALSLQLLAARAAGGRVSGPLESRIKDLFIYRPDPESMDAPEPVRTFVGALAAATGEKGPGRDYLLTQFVSRQGSGRKSWAIDASGLLKALEGVQPCLPSAGLLRRIDPQLGERLVPAVRELNLFLREDFTRTRRRILEWIGDASLTGLRDEYTDLAKLALEAGRSVRAARALQDRAEAIDGTLCRTLMNQLQEIEEEREDALPAVLSLNWAQFKALRMFIETADSFHTELDADLGYLETTGQSEFEDAIRRGFEQKIDRARKLLEVMKDDVHN